MKDSCGGRWNRRGRRWAWRRRTRRSDSSRFSLEPCNHHGRTGPCAETLIAAGVRRVVAATVDPNRQVSGQGIARLRAAGVEVAVGVCEAEAREVNDAFARWIRTDRPLVTLKAGLSADGMLAPPPAKRTQRQTHWITGAEARAEVQRMRHAADAVARPEAFHEGWWG